MLKSCCGNKKMKKREFSFLPSGVKGFALFMVSSRGDSRGLPSEEIFTERVSK